MQMSTLKGWHGGHQEEAPKEELRHLTLKGMIIYIYCMRRLSPEQSRWTITLEIDIVDSMVTNLSPGSYNFDVWCKF